MTPLRRVICLMMSAVTPDNLAALNRIGSHGSRRFNTPSLKSTQDSDVVIYNSKSGRTLCPPPCRPTAAWRRPVPAWGCPGWWHAAPSARACTARPLEVRCLHHQSQLKQAKPRTKCKVSNVTKFLCQYKISLLCKVVQGWDFSKYFPLLRPRALLNLKPLGIFHWRLHLYQPMGQRT